MVKFYALHAAAVFFTTPASAYESKVERLPLVSPASIKRQLAARNLDRTLAEESRQLLGESRQLEEMSRLDFVMIILPILAKIFNIFGQWKDQIKKCEEGKLSVMLWWPAFLTFVSAVFQFATGFDITAPHVDQLYGIIAWLKTAMTLSVNIYQIYVNPENWYPVEPVDPVEVKEVEVKEVEVKEVEVDVEKARLKGWKIFEVVWKSAACILMQIAAILLYFAPKKYFVLFGGKKEAVSWTSKLFASSSNITLLTQMLVNWQGQNLSWWFLLDKLYSIFVEQWSFLVAMFTKKKKFTLENIRKLIDSILEIIIFLLETLVLPYPDEKKIDPTNKIKIKTETVAEEIEN